MRSEPATQLVQGASRGSKLAKRLALYTGAVAVLFACSAGIDFLFGFKVRGSLNLTSLVSAIGMLPLSFDVLAVFFMFVWLAGSILIAWRFWLSTQNTCTPSRTELEKDEVVRAVRARYQKNFWVSFALYSAVMLLAILAYFIIKDSRIWYADDPWFVLLATLRSLFPLAIVFIWAAGAVILLFMQWRKSSSDIVALIDSIEQMQAGKGKALIGVPRNLQELQPLLQGIYDKALEHRLSAEEAEKRRSELILYLAHDLKTPLTSIVGYLSLLEESGELSEAQKTRFTGIAKQKALKLEALIEQFFEVSRYNFADLELRKIDFSLDLMLSQLVEEFFPLADEQDKELELSVERGLIFYGDPDMLARAIGNVLKNALAYSFDASKVKIEACRSKDGLHIAVANKGSAIPAGQQAQIFERFYRLDTARASNTGGSGLGLAIAKELIEWHGGTIEAASAGNETVFTITLPAP